MSDGIKTSIPEAPRQPEQLSTPEAPKEGALETRGERKTVEQPATQSKKEQAPMPPLVTPLPLAPVASVKSQLQQDIEDILAEDLKELYASLSPQQKLHFRKEGEKTAARIEILLKSVRIKISEILKLIRAWLSILPGVNKYFLEKEVKIKTEHILELKNERNE